MDAVKKYPSFLVQTCAGLSAKYLTCIAFGYTALPERQNELQFDHYVYGRGETVEDAMAEAWHKFEEYPHGKTHSKKAA